MAIACDIQKSEPAAPSGAPLFVVGTSIEGSGGVVPADGVIQVAFDRYLLPATITRQSFAILDNTNQLIAGLAPQSTYDPVARTVTIFGSEGPGRPWLTSGSFYKLYLPVAEDPTSDIGGFRAIDRAPLSPKQNLQFVFRAGPPTGKTTFEPSVDFCTDVLPLLWAKCGGGACHGATASAASGLVLENSAGVRTAIGRVAHGSNIDPHASLVAAAPSNFGANMAVIAPGDPGSSWLTYKLEIARPLATSVPKPKIACFPTTPPIAPAAPEIVPLAPFRPEPSESERSILDNFILGREMPYPSLSTEPATWFSAPLDFQERERIRVWIARGAEVRDCSFCDTGQ